MFSMQAIDPLAKRSSGILINLSIIFAHLAPMCQVQLWCYFPISTSVMDLPSSTWPIYYSSPVLLNICVLGRLENAFAICQDKKYIAMRDVSFVSIELKALHINDVEAVQSRQKRVGTSRQL